MSKKVVAIFQSTSFDMSWSEENVDQEPPLGKDCAEYLREALRAEGAEPLFDEPIQGEGGWDVDLKLGDQGYVLFIHWAPIGDPAEDYWAIQPRLRRGLVASLFGGQPKDDKLMPVVEVLRGILRGDKFQKVRWLTREEFAVLY